jgi:paraquat-inducible protein B
VTIALEPGRLRLANEEWRPDARPQMDEMLRDLIGKGLRARIGATVPVIGGKEVELAFVPEAAPASLGGGSPPEIPNADSSTDVQDIVAKVDGVVRRIDAMPLPQIAFDIHETTSRLAALSSSPELTEDLHRLDRSMASVERITGEASKQTGPILSELRRAADEAQATLASATSVLGGRGASSSLDAAAVPQTLYELARAARSLRELSDYLDQHLEAFLKGRG